MIMGYTHYWHQAAGIPADLFAEIARDAKVIVQNSPVPLAGWDGTGEPEISDTEVGLNGADPDDYETFVLRPEASDFNFCKTGERPYDIVVTAILFRAAKLCQERGVSFTIDSDGGLEGFTDGRKFQEGLFR
jgi:hypothetical protein